MSSLNRPTSKDWFAHVNGQTAHALNVNDVAENVFSYTPKHLTRNRAALTTHICAKGFFLALLIFGAVTVLIADTFTLVTFLRFTLILMLTGPTKSLGCARTIVFLAERAKALLLTRAITVSLANTLLAFAFVRQAFRIFLTTLTNALRALCLATAVILLTHRAMTLLA